MHSQPFPYGSKSTTANGCETTMIEEVEGLVPARLAQVVSFGIRRVFRQKIAARIRASIQNLDDLKASLQFAMNFEYMGFKVIKPQQVETEVLQLLKLLKPLEPKTVLEIGAGTGGTLFLWTRVAHPDARIICVDRPFGSILGGDPDFRSVIFSSFARGRQCVELLLGNSHDCALSDSIETMLDGRPLDFVFIDGDHTYEGVRRDYVTFGRLVSEGGVIAFHDIIEDPTHPGWGAHTFWNEIKSGKEHYEFVHDYRQGRSGIGALVVHKQEAEVESRAEAGL